MPATCDPSQVRMNIDELGSITSSRSPDAPPDARRVAATLRATSKISANVHVSPSSGQSR